MRFKRRWKEKSVEGAKKKQIKKEMAKSDSLKKNNVGVIMSESKFLTILG
jgi:hypothetical protein